MKRRRNSRCGEYFSSLKTLYERRKCRLKYDSSSGSDEEIDCSKLKNEPIPITGIVTPEVIITRSNYTQTTNTLTYVTANVISSGIEALSV